MSQKKKKIERKIRCEEEEDGEKGQRAPHKWEHFVSSVQEKEVEIQDYPVSSRLSDLLSVRKDLEMSV